jgi:hypothetical protein
VDAAVDGAVDTSSDAAITALKSKFSGSKRTRTDANPDAYRDANANRDQHAGRADADLDAHANKDADQHPHGHANQHANAHQHGDGDGNTNGNRHATHGYTAALPLHRQRRPYLERRLHQPYSAGG